MEIEFKVGQYIRKSNYMPFTTGVPVTKIRNVNYSKKGVPCINGITYNDDGPVVISNEERVELMEEWNTLCISPIPVIVGKHSHIREDTGKPKEPLSIESIRAITFSYKHKKDGGLKDIEGYRCPECLHYHIGKRLKDEKISNKFYFYTLYSQ